MDQLTSSTPSSSRGVGARALAGSRLRGQDGDIASEIPIIQMLDLICQSSISTTFSLIIFTSLFIVFLSSFFVYLFPCLFHLQTVSFGHLVIYSTFLRDILQSFFFLFH